MVRGKDGKKREHTSFGGSAKRTSNKHQGGLRRAREDQERNPNPNTAAGRAIIAAQKKAEADARRIAAEKKARHAKKKGRER